MIPLKRGNVFVASWASRFHILLRGRVLDRYQRGVNKAIDCALRNSVLRNESRSNAHAQPARVTRKRITRPAFEAKGEKRRRIPKALASPRLPIILFASPLPLSNNSTDFSIEMYSFNSFTRITTILKVKFDCC